jgi:quercetin dioxygenase-like cupin family protein
MKRLTVYIALVVAGLILLGTTEASAQKKMAKTLWAAEDLKWEAMQGGPPGVMTALLRGDQTKGAYEGLTKFPAGFKAPLHTHTYDTKIVVIKGAYTYNGKNYGPGSYLFIPGGDKHVSGGTADSETIFFMEQPGKFDMKPVEPPKAKK